jgi:citronellol/citronellal dehydrogenase
MTQAAERLKPTRTPRSWGFSDEQLATYPVVFKPGLLDGKVYLVSGGGSGMGRAMAYLLARLGADVMICGRRLDKLDETAAGIEKHVGRRIATQAMTMMDATYERFGRLDVVVNNGGGQFPQPAIDFSVKGWLAVIDTNLNGTWYMMQSAARRWRDRGEPGSIVNIVANVWRGMPQVAHTCAARAGVIYLSKTLSTEWAPLRIRVNCISPGSISTEGLNVYPEEAVEHFAKSNPMRSLGDVYDVAQGVVYMSADTAKFITGEVLVIDGGNNQWGDVWPGGKPDYFRVDD